MSKPTVVSATSLQVSEPVTEAGGKTCQANVLSMALPRKMTPSSQNPCRETDFDRSALLRGDVLVPRLHAADLTDGLNLRGTQRDIYQTSGPNQVCVGMQCRRLRVAGP